MSSSSLLEVDELEEDIGLLEDVDIELDELDEYLDHSHVSTTSISQDSLIVSQLRAVLHKNIALHVCMISIIYIYYVLIFIFHLETSKKNYLLSSVISCSFNLIYCCYAGKMNVFYMYIVLNICVDGCRRYCTFYES